MATELQHKFAEEINIKGCSPSCSQLLATSWILPGGDNVEHTLVTLTGIFSGSPHLGGILLIFTVILCPALSSRHLINFPLVTVAFCYPNSPQPARLSWSCQKQGFLCGAGHTQLWHRASVITEATLNEEGKRSEWRTGGWWGRGRQWERKGE